MRRSYLAAVSLFALAMAGGPASAQPIEGLYVGVSGGVNFLDTERIRGATVNGVGIRSNTTMDYKAGWVALGSVGYALGNGVRLEVEGNGRNSQRSFTTLPGIVSQKGDETKTGVMANVFFDTDIGSRYVFPYFGAGAGYQSVNQSLTSVQTNGTTLRINGANAAFAYQAVFGAAFPIPGVVGLSLTTEYRFLGVNSTRTYPGSVSTLGLSVPATRRTSDNNNHNILVGLRYAFNVTPPAAPAAAPLPAAAPAAVAARSYLVFFDWDRADLNDRARQIVSEAAQASKRVAETRIELAGHADQSGTVGYNLTLSRKRADAVAGELVRLGVAATSISVTAFGDTKPLVPTKAGEREPQNRRVEIVLK